METGIDFLQYLESDMAVKIFTCLSDPADLVRASLASRNWKYFVVSSGLSKKLCLQVFPQLSNIVAVDEQTDVGSGKLMNTDNLQIEHRVYASLLQALGKLQSFPVDCISAAFSASSTDNYPDETVMNTLDHWIQISRTPSYWSSKGQRDPSVPETLVYKLKADLCVITEICIRPFQAFFQPGEPIYSSKSVRFRMGHPKNPTEVESDLLCLPLHVSDDDKFIWTYTSEEFPMSQENRLQHFKFKEAVVCIGGYLEIQLLGRVQKQEMDDLFYTCVAHVRALGRPLSPAFHVEINESTGKLSLQSFPNELQPLLQNAANGSDSNAANSSIVPSEEIVWRHVGLLQYIIGGNHVNEEDEDEDEDEEDEEDEEEIIIGHGEVEYDELEEL